MINSSDYFLDFQVQPPHAIALEPEQIEQAIQLSKLSTPEQQWQTYLNALALFGFEAWLTDRDPELIIEKDHFINNKNAICQIKIGEFKICLLAQGILDDENVIIPSAVLDSPDDLSHFYITLKVDEEQEQTSIEGFIRYDQLQTFRQSGHLFLQSDQTFLIPYTEFDTEPNNLLLYLRCLDPLAIQLPNSSAIPQQELENQIISERGTPLTQSVINVGLWLQGQLDEICENLSWMLLPSPELVSSFRSSSTLNSMIEQLRQQGMTIPNTARGALLPFELADFTLELSTLVWLIEGGSQWSLLLFLGMPSDQLLPEGLKLEIKDANGILGEQQIEPNSDQSYLYMQVVSELDEEFIVTIALNNETFPPLIFRFE